ncbi:hypothetical protein [Cohnella fermenti]|uniref:Lipoprotein n=1 Tax=Cohnella fermenti TaxID=2565925 RepID=A0A4S4C8T7_9BACL|nr:hypothetical protein [Cohnella fermenti]THF84090.1 hypothetical protein E6C55_01930 [Cohnella fermenti]
MRRTLSLFTAGLLALLLAGCGAADRSDGNSGTVSAPSANTEATQSSSPADSGGSGSPSASASASAPALSAEEQSLAAAADEVIGALRDRDLARLASWTDSAHGLRFSPYPHMNDTDRVFQADRFPSFKDDGALEWGSYDGSGEPIKLSFRDYFEKFVYDEDFADATAVSIAKLASSGNMTYNGEELYPGSSFVEYYFPGFDKKLEGHDWESLILTFVPNGTDWRLVAVTHGQWTI